MVPLKSPAKFSQVLRLELMVSLSLPTAWHAGTLLPCADSAPRGPPTVSGLGDALITSWDSGVSLEFEFQLLLFLVALKSCLTDLLRL